MRTPRRPNVLWLPNDVTDEVRETGMSVQEGKDSLWKFISTSTSLVSEADSFVRPVAVPRLINDSDGHDECGLAQAFRVWE